MAIWQVEIFDNPSDQTPIVRGFVEADNEDSAVQLVTNAMGEAKRADMTPTAKQLAAIPNGIVLWERV